MRHESAGVAEIKKSKKEKKSTSKILNELNRRLREEPEERGVILEETLNDLNFEKMYDFETIQEAWNELQWDASRDIYWRGDSPEALFPLIEGNESIELESDFPNVADTPITSIGYFGKTAGSDFNICVGFKMPERASLVQKDIKAESFEEVKNQIGNFVFNGSFSLDDVEFVIVRPKVPDKKGKRKFRPGDVYVYKKT